MKRPKKRPLRLGQIGWLHDDRGPGFETVAWCDINEAKLKKPCPRPPT